MKLRLLSLVFQFARLVLLSHQQDIQTALSESSVPAHHLPRGHHHHTSIVPVPADTDKNEDVLPRDLKPREPYKPDRDMSPSPDYFDDTAALADNPLYKPSNVKTLRQPHKSNHWWERQEKRYFRNITNSQAELKKEIRVANLRVENVHKGVKNVKSHLLGIEAVGSIMLVAKMVLPIIRDYFLRRSGAHPRDAHEMETINKPPTRSSLRRP